jgi:hypothetical protein
MIITQRTDGYIRSAGIQGPPGSIGPDGPQGIQGAQGIQGPAGSSVAHTLQATYDISTTPEIVTNSTQKALTLKRGSAADSDSVIEVQNGGGTITSKILGDGTYVFPKTAGIGFKLDTTSPTYPWKDLIGHIDIDVTGANAATLTPFMGGNVRAYAFGPLDKCDLVFHIPHDYVPGSDLFVHVHWSHNGLTISGSFLGTIAYTYSKGHNQGIFGAEKTVTIPYNTVNIATTPRYVHRIDEVQLSSNGGSASLLDSNLIEVDGLIAMNYTQTTAPSIASGTPNEPFIFFIDIHYQSTGTGTKQKAPPFWT